MPRHILACIAALCIAAACSAREQTYREAVLELRQQIIKQEAYLKILKKTVKTMRKSIAYGAAQQQVAMLEAKIKEDKKLLVDLVRGGEAKFQRQRKADKKAKVEVARKKVSREGYLRRLFREELARRAAGMEDMEASIRAASAAVQARGGTTEEEKAYTRKIEESFLVSLLGSRERIRGYQGVILRHIVATSKKYDTILHCGSLAWTRVCLWKIIRSGAETFEEAAMDEDDATFMRKVRAPKSDEHKALWDVALEDVRRRFAMHSSDELRRRFDTFMGMTYDRNRYPQKSPLGVLGVFVRTARRDPVRAAVTLCDPYIHMHQAGIRVALEDKERQKRVALYLERVEKRMQNGEVLLGCNVIAVDQLE
ncbi:MAG: hypothetical protein ACYS9X_00740 [Planctomycetota bacterium]|jgi:hypothetical protein